MANNRYVCRSVPGARRQSTSGSAVGGGGGPTARGGYAFLSYLFLYTYLSMPPCMDDGTDGCVSGARHGLCQARRAAC